MVFLLNQMIITISSSSPEHPEIVARWDVRVVPRPPTPRWPATRRFMMIYPCHDMMGSPDFKKYRKERWIGTIGKQWKTHFMIFLWFSYGFPILWCVSIFVWGLVYIIIVNIIGNNVYICIHTSWHIHDYTLLIFLNFTSSWDFGISREY